MSRIGKKIIQIPAQIEVSVSGATLTVKGPKGTLTRTIPSEVEVKVEGREARIIPKGDSLQERSVWGTYGSHLHNMIEGVTKGFEKKLIIEGIGYKAELKGTNVVLSLGFSHPIVLPVPEGVKVSIEKGVVSAVGPDKDVIGQFVAKIRSLKKPEPYKGKGVRHEHEVIQRKQGKKTA